MYLTRKERIALQHASNEGIAAINELVFRLKTENPEAFHTPRSLHERTFFLEPRHGVPCHRFLHPAGIYAALPLPEGKHR